jgi:predicted molibdopterin-dependent oxidoreductase YjgC
VIELTINGTKNKFPEGQTLLECIESVGIKVPTLCYHKALTPYGACRLCLVEISQNGRSTIQASCTYPASNNLVINTNSERVTKTRKIMIELLLTRCPDSEAIKQIAEDYGIKETRFEKKNDDCFLCGLCVRMCQERMGISAISFINRGSDRKVCPPFDTASDVCQSCGACFSICPTERIKLEEVGKNTSIPIPSEFDEGLMDRSAAYIPYPQAVPNKATIDDRYCAHILKDQCEVCKEFCEAEAIDHENRKNRISN